MSNLAAQRNAKVPLRGSSYMNDFLREVFSEVFDFGVLRVSVTLYFPTESHPILDSGDALQPGCIRNFILNSYWKGTIRDENWHANRWGRLPWAECGYPGRGA